MEPSFEAVPGTGIAVVDPIDRHRYVMRTRTPVSPVPIATENFRFPVDAAVSVHTSALSLPSVVSVHIRDDDGITRRTAEHFAGVNLPAKTYEIELSAPLKLYVRVESAVSVSADAERTTVEFDEETTVQVGARSHHSHPATTLTTPADPEQLMQAVSTFGSALKTHSPERSYPTLRGHPPAVELGDTLDLAGLEPPETGITIEIPPTYRAVFVVAPLAYYLGARVVPGETPCIRTDMGFEYPLEGVIGFERTVERILKQVFFLDCLTRTEGLYPVDLHERRELEPVLGFDFGALYDRPLAAQLEAYLGVDFEALAAHLPEWKLTAHADPTPASVETLPFLVDDLAVVRCGGIEEVTNSSGTIPGGCVSTTRGSVVAGDFTRSASRGTPVETDRTYIEPGSDNSLEQAWVGEGTPVGASKATIDAYRNRLDRTPVEGDIRVKVVCNDSEMDEERALVNEVYGERDLPFEVSVECDLTTDELEAALATRTDFFHYVGHVDDTGFECVDGTLDADSLDSVGVDAFLLNACQSYEQGMSLIENGSIGGIVTLSDVLNDEAVRIGETLARLLNAGFPLRAALTIAREESIMGDEYLVVGDGGFALAQSSSGTPNLIDVLREGNSYIIEITTYPTSNRGMGSLVMPIIRHVSEYYLSSGYIGRFDLSREELIEFLKLETIPVRVDGKLRWSNQLDVDEL